MQISDLHYKIALTYIPNIGPKSLKKLLVYLGDFKELFHEKKSNLLKIRGIGASFINNFNKEKVLSDADKQINFIQKNDISPLFFLDDTYPQRLKECVDAPIILYIQGNCDLNTPKALSIVGTRAATEYGKSLVKNLVKELAGKYKEMLIVSGLAYGIDITAHRAAIEYGLPTVSVLGHGLEKIYPAVHTKYVKDITENGVLATEFPMGSQVLPGNFIQRNRIIAGLSNATVIVESGKRSGALFTAYMADSYHRDVFAFPGRTTDSTFEGNNNLIKKNIAHFIESAGDIEYILRWQTDTEKEVAAQKKLFVNLTPEEEKIYSLLNQHPKMHVDEICGELPLTMSQIVSLLLKLEFDGVVKSLPGKSYSLAN